MEPALARALIPVGTTLIVFAMPVAIVFITRYFKLKNRELDVEAEIQKRWTEESRRQLEARVASLENAVSAVLQIVAPRQVAQPPQGAAAAQAQLAQVAEPPPSPGGAQLAAPLRERG
jgi:hypothetical protein